MQLAASPINHVALRAFAALLRRWLGIVLLIVTTGWARGDAPSSDALARAERRLKQFLFARAVERIGARRSRAHAHPSSAPRGFRRTRHHGGNLRQLTRNVLPKLRGSDPGARLARIQHVLDRVEVFVARLLKRLRRNQPATRLIAVAPSARFLISGAPALAISAADSS